MRIDRNEGKAVQYVVLYWVCAVSLYMYCMCCMCCSGGLRPVAWQTAQPAPPSANSSEQGSAGQLDSPIARGGDERQQSGERAQAAATQLLWSQAEGHHTTCLLGGRSVYGRVYGVYDCTRYCTVWSAVERHCHKPGRGACDAAAEAAPQRQHCPRGLRGLQVLAIGKTTTPSSFAGAPHDCAA